MPLEPLAGRQDTVEGPSAEATCQASLVRLKTGYSPMRASGSKGFPTPGRRAAQASAKLELDSAGI
jgi:hypothetical protein